VLIIIKLCPALIWNDEAYILLPLLQACKYQYYRACLLLKWCIPN